jgi:hypothetical protein
MPAVRAVALKAEKESRNLWRQATLVGLIIPGWSDPKPVPDRHTVDTSAQKSMQQNAKPGWAAIGIFVNHIASENPGSKVPPT